MIKKCAEIYYLNVYHKIINLNKCCHRIVKIDLNITGKIPCVTALTIILLPRPQKGLIFTVNLNIISRLLFFMFSISEYYYCFILRVYISYKEYYYFIDVRVHAEVYTNYYIIYIILNIIISINNIYIMY